MVFFMYSMAPKKNKTKKHQVNSSFVHFERLYWVLYCCIELFHLYTCLTLLSLTDVALQGKRGPGS